MHFIFIPFLLVYNLIPRVVDLTCFLLSLLQTSIPQALLCTLEWSTSYYQDIPHKYSPKEAHTCAAWNTTFGCLPWQGLASIAAAVTNSTNSMKMHFLRAFLGVKLSSPCSSPAALRSEKEKRQLKAKE